MVRFLHKGQVTRKAFSYVGFKMNWFNHSGATTGIYRKYNISDIPDNKVHGANMGHSWVLSAPGGPHVGPVNLAIGDGFWWPGHGIGYAGYIYIYVYDNEWAWVVNCLVGHGNILPLCCGGLFYFVVAVIAFVHTNSSPRHVQFLLLTRHNGLRITINKLIFTYRPREGLLITCDVQICNSSQDM